MPIQKKALVLLSGGIDSAVVLWWAKNKGWKIATLSFFFPGRRKGEVLATRKLQKLIGSGEHYKVCLDFIEPPQSEEACYIPKRNLMFYGIASSIAERIKADFIIGGHTQHDGEVFADAHKKYLSQIDRLVQSPGKTNHSVRLLFPFINSTKKTIIKTGSSLAIPFNHTWSCSNHGKKHCWKCNSCRERRDGFQRARVKDPLGG